jgi:hypothetical protein
VYWASIRIFISRNMPKGSTGTLHKVSIEK